MNYRIPQNSDSNGSMFSIKKNKNDFFFLFKRRNQSPKNSKFEIKILIDTIYQSGTHKISKKTIYLFYNQRSQG